MATGGHASEPDIEAPSTGVQSDRPGRAIVAEGMAGALTALVIFAYSVSFAGLVFSGPLAGHVDLAVAAALGSAAVATGCNALFGSLRFGVVAPDTPVIALLGTMAAGVAVSDTAQFPAEAALSQGIAAFALCSAVTGALLLGVGVFRLSKWVRFIPYTVIAAFLAASGWFLVTGALGMATGASLPEAWAALDDTDAMARLGATLAVAATLWLARLATGAALSTPVTVLTGFALFAVSVQLTGADPTALREAGWLFPAPAATPPALPPILVVLETPPVMAPFFGTLPEILTIAGVATIAIFLNASGLEAETGRDLDLDRDYRANGTANLLLAAVGGLPSNLSLNRSYMNFTAGGTTRVSALAAALGCLAISAAANPLAAIAPKPLLAGMLLFMGATMLRRWLLDTARQFSTGNWLTALAIFLLIVTVGYVEGAVLGVVAACLTFAFSYGRTPFVRLAMTRADCASYVERSGTEEALLRAEGGRVLIYRLQGFLFFGSAHRVSRAVRLAVEREAAAVSSVLLDFRFVTGMDASADAAFERLCRRLREQGVRICLTELPEAGWSDALAARVARDPQGQARFPTLDAGLEWCERVLLADLGADRRTPRSVEAWLRDELGTEAAALLLARMQRRQAAAGAVICPQGGPADTMLFVGSGKVSIYLERDGAPPLLLKTMLGETVIGEIGFFKKLPRSASVVAETDAEYLEIDRAGFEALRREVPLACAALQELILRVLADRLVFANRELAVQRR
jgi:SulP family sulfate permease